MKKIVLLELKPYLIFSSIVCYIPIIVFLGKNILKSKNTNIWYLMFHFILLVFILLSSLLDQLNLFSINVELTTFLLILTFIVYYIYIHNLENDKSGYKLNLILVTIFFVIINLFETEIFGETFKNIKIIRFTNKTYITISNILTYYLFIIYIIILTWHNISKIHNKTKTTIEKQILKKWIIPYTILISIAFVVSGIPFKFFGIYYVSVFSFINSVVLFIMAIYLLFSPRLLVNISKSFIKKQQIISKSKDLIFLDKLLFKDKHYLDREMNLIKFAGIINKSPVEIRRTLKINNFNNFKEYLNSFRAIHLKNLISSGYLNTYSVDAALKKSGFNSHQTMSRTFKINFKMTAKEYWEKVKST